MMEPGRLRALCRTWQQCYAVAQAMASTVMAPRTPGGFSNSFTSMFNASGGYGGWLT